METRAVNHPTGRGFVCVVQQVRLVFFYCNRFNIALAVYHLFVFTEFTFSTTPGVR